MMSSRLFSVLCAIALSATISFGLSYAASFISGGILSYAYGAGVVVGQTTWPAGNGHTYAIVEFPAEPWTSASIDITSTLPGFHLATITSQAEQDFIWNFVLQNPVGGWQWWLGGFQDLLDETDPAAGWMWVTGEPWDYTNWGSSEPNDAGGIEDHLTLSGDSWNDEGSAISSVGGYIAEKSASPILDIEKLTNVNQADGANWSDVPRINEGNTVSWTYVVTNNGQAGFSGADISVADSQPDVNPALDTTSDDGDMILSPGETWIYTAFAEAMDLSSPPAGVTVVPGCGDGRNTYQNVGQVGVVGLGVIDQDFSHYCNLGLGVDIRKETEGPDSRTFPSGSNVPFEIQIINTGTIDLDNVIVSDPQVPTCDRNISFLSAGASTTYVCNALNITQDFQNEACVSAQSTQTLTVTVGDCDSSAVEVVPPPIIVASEYYPLADNNTWTYLVDDLFTDTATVIPGTTLINGVWAKQLLYTDGDTDYFTSDLNGILWHGSLDVSPPPELTATFIPPFSYAPGITYVPNVINQSGTVSMSIPSISSTPFVYNYTGTTYVEAFEIITVPAGTYRALRVQNILRMFGSSQGVPIELSVSGFDWLAKYIGPVKSTYTDSDGTQTSVLTSTNIRPPLFSAVLPASRSVQVLAPATAFATIANPSGATATGCSISPLTNLPADFLYQTTDPLTNMPIGAPNTPATIVPEAFQTFMFAFTPTAAFSPTTVELQFSCTNTAAAPIVTGINTLLMSASDTPIPDIIAMAATLSGDGIISIPMATRTNAFSVATANVGAAGLVTALADTGDTNLPLVTLICETDPLTAACIAPAQPSVATSIGPNATPTFSIFVSIAGDIPFDPANNRIFVRFIDAGGVTRGSTSVAVRTQ